VILCGFGRVGQSVGRVLESQGFEYIAVDLDPARIRAARRAGDPVIYGDSSDEEMLNLAGVATASAVVVSFSNPGVALSIVKSVRLIRSDVPVLVRTQDDARIDELRGAGATEVVPETFEASMMLVSQVLMLLQMPVFFVLYRILHGLTQGDGHGHFAPAYLDHTAAFAAWGPVVIEYGVIHSIDKVLLPK